MKNLLHKFTGFSVDVISNLEKSDQQKIALMGGIMIYTSLVSATFMSYAFAVMSFHNPYLIPAIFFLWFIFVYFFERLIISGRKVNKLILITRFIAALAFSLIHSLIMDVLFFQTDIQESFLNQNKVMAAHISKDFRAKISSNTKMMNDLIAQNQKISDKIIHLRNQIVSEADGSSGTHKQGLGPIFDLKRKMFLPEIKALNKNFNDNKKAIVDYKNRIEAIKIKEDQEINKIIPPDGHGLLNNIRQLNQVEFVHGDFVSRLFATLFLLIFIFIETLPLFTKLSLNISSYYHIVDMAKKESEKKAFMVYEQKSINESNIIILSSKSQQLANYQRANNEKMASFNAIISRRILALNNTIQEVEDKKAEFEQKYPLLTDSHIKPFFDGLYKEINKFYNNLKIQIS